jgi:hypothetical protein
MLLEMFKLEVSQLMILLLKDMEILDQIDQVDAHGGVGFLLVYFPYFSLADYLHVVYPLFLIINLNKIEKVVQVSLQNKTVNK